MTPTEGTSLGGGIVATVEAIEAAQARTPADYYSSRSQDPEATPVPPAAGPDDATIIVLFSDGEDTSDEDPVEAAAFATERGIRIVTLGVGTAEGATLDLDGFQVQSRLDEGTLRAIAEATGGAYEAAAEEDPAGLVYDELERRLVVRTEGQEVTAIVAAVGLALLLAGVGLSLARAGRLP
jgi:Ca-activated chloride channel homolog